MAPFLRIPCHPLPLYMITHTPFEMRSIGQTKCSSHTITTHTWQTVKRNQGVIITRHIARADRGAIYTEKSACVLHVRARVGIYLGRWGANLAVPQVRTEVPQAQDAT